MIKAFSEDPIVSAIYAGIKDDIEHNVSQNRIRAALILIYCGIDAMAFLSLDQGKFDVKGADYIKWAERYIRFPGKAQLTGLDLYGARCSMAHTYGSDSKILREGRCHQIIPVTGMQPHISFLPAYPNQVLVSVTSLRDAFFQGIDAFLIDMFADNEKRIQIEERLEHLMVPTSLTEDFVRAMGY